MIQSVGKSIIKGDKPRKFSYRDVKFDKDGWADAKKYLPIPFDLLYVKVDDTDDEDSVLSAWWNGKYWDGLYVDRKFYPLYWKRQFEEKE